MPTTTSTSPLPLRRLLERRERVFPPYPQVDLYFPAASIEDARVRLTRAIERGDGPGLVVGGPGTGKSLLLQVLAAQFHQRFDVVLLATARVCTRRALLQAILFELGLPYQYRDEGDLRLSLLDHLLSVDKSPEGLLALVDEAQALSPALLDELRVMTNLVRGGAPRLRLVLAGTSALEESFANPELESFSQRLSARCYLAPFSREETTQFIRAQIAAAAVSPDDVLEESACTAVFDATDGVPRLVNQLCDSALLLASSQNCRLVDRDVIQAAWADLQQLPTHWENPTTTTAYSAAADVVEFGSLLDHAPVDDELVEDESFVVDPTDLDADDEVAGPMGAGITFENATATQPAAVAPEPTFAFQEYGAPAEPPAIDPFAEQFDNEEVVLDNFAAWDDMFHHQTPRVENRRDPGFANLVQVAIEASPGGHPRFETPAFKVIEAHAAFVASSKTSGSRYTFNDQPTAHREKTLPTDALLDDEPPIGERPVDPPLEPWPSLRLAVVSDPAPLTPMPLVSAGSPPQAAASNTVSYERAACASGILTEIAGNFFADRPAAAREETTRTSSFAWEEAPLLVIEDDPAPSDTVTPPVRHEEYRYLFSRLRGD
jgi:type II secretory pathway predicted ATPase ExeA